VLAVPESARATLRRLLPANTVNWALTGFFLSLGPTLVRQLTESASPLAGGALIACMVMPSAVASVLVQGRTPVRVLQVGASGLVVGLVVALVGIYWRVPAALFVGTVIAGCSMGSSFSGTLRSLAPLAPAQQRAGLMASFFVCSYVAFSVPAILAGLSTNLFGLPKQHHRDELEHQRAHDHHAPAQMVRQPAEHQQRGQQRKRIAGKDRRQRERREAPGLAVQRIQGRRGTGGRQEDDHHGGGPPHGR
jgi:hypothetical protein